jgi:hypothetical protein
MEVLPAKTACTVREANERNSWSIREGVNHEFLKAAKYCSACVALHSRSGWLAAGLEPLELSSSSLSNQGLMPRVITKPATSHQQELDPAVQGIGDVGDLLKTR